MAESALYRHFQSKDQILAAVLEHFSQFDLAVEKTIQAQNMTPKDGLLFLMKSYVEYYESYPAITAVFESFNAFLRNPHTEQLGKEIYQQRFICLKELINKGQEQGEISRRFSSEELADILNGYFQWIIIKWRMSNYTFSLKNSVMSTLEKVIETGEIR